MESHALSYAPAKYIKTFTLLQRSRAIQPYKGEVPVFQENARSFKISVHYLKDYVIKIFYLMQIHVKNTMQLTKRS